MKNRRGDNARWKPTHLQTTTTALWSNIEAPPVDTNFSSVHALTCRLSCQSSCMSARLGKLRCQRVWLEGEREGGGGGGRCANPTSSRGLLEGPHSIFRQRRCLQQLPVLEQQPHLQTCAATDNGCQYAQAPLATWHPPTSSASLNGGALCGAVRRAELLQMCGNCQGEPPRSLASRVLRALARSSVLLQVSLVGGHGPGGYLAAARGRGPAAEGVSCAASRTAA